MMDDRKRGPSRLLTRADDESAWLMEAYRRGYRGGYWFRDKAIRPVHYANDSEYLLTWNKGHAQGVYDYHYSPVIPPWFEAEMKVRKDSS